MLTIPVPRPAPPGQSPAAPPSSGAATARAPPAARPAKASPPYAKRAAERRAGNAAHRAGLLRHPHRRRHRHHHNRQLRRTFPSLKRPGSELREASRRGGGPGRAGEREQEKEREHIGVSRGEGGRARGAAGRAGGVCTLELSGHSHRRAS